MEPLDNPFRIRSNLKYRTCMNKTIIIIARETHLLRHGFQSTPRLLAGCLLKQFRPQRHIKNLDNKWCSTRTLIFRLPCFQSSEKTPNVPKMLYLLLQIHVQYFGWQLLIHLAFYIFGLFFCSEPSQTVIEIQDNAKVFDKLDLTSGSNFPLCGLKYQLFSFGWELCNPLLFKERQKLKPKTGETRSIWFS